MNSTRRPGRRKESPRPRVEAGGFLWKDPGDDRLSRQRHYHGPGGLNGRVRNGNGCGPASMVAGKSDRDGGQAARPQAIRWSGHVEAQDNQAKRGVSWTIPSYPHAWLALRTVEVRRSSRRWDTGNVTPTDRLAPPLVAGDGSGWSSDRLLELVRCGGRPPCTPSPSTWSSSRSLHSLRYWKPRLEEGFALRCLQRLSFPDLATRRCPERDSRHTRGRSSPILSY